jgi:hypothetical protein
MPWRRVAAFTAALLSGCTLLTGLDGLSGGNAGVHDGGPGTPDAPGPADGASEGGALIDAGTCDADFNADPHNCGACGHDCLGGDCFGASCTPVTIVAAPVDPPDEALAVHKGKIYWASFSANTVHAGQNELVANGLDNPSGLGFRGDELLITNYDDGTLVTAGSSVGAVSQLASGLGKPGCFGTDEAGDVYISDYTGGRVMRVTSTATTPVAEGQSSPWGVAAIDGTLYWTNLGDGTIHRAKPDGSSATVILGGEDGASCLVADATYLYWVSDKGVRRVERAGGTPKTIGFGSAHLGIAIDDVSVYFTDGSRILRLAK